MIILFLGCGLPLILGSSAPEPELDDHGMPIAGATEGKQHEEAPPAFAFFVRGIEPDFTDIVLKALLAPIEEDALSFPSEFSVRWVTPSGRAVQIPLTPVKEKNVLAAKIHGPLEPGIHFIQATLVMRDEDGFVARVAEQQAELDSRTLRLQAGPLKLFPDEEFLRHKNDEEATGSFSIGAILPVLGSAICVLLVVGLIFLLRKRGVKIGSLIGIIGPVFGRVRAVLRPLTAKLEPIVRPLLVKLSAIAPKRLRRVIPSGGQEERLSRDGVMTGGQEPTDILASATEVAAPDQSPGGSNEDAIEDQPTAIETGSEAPEQPSEQASEQAPKHATEQATEQESGQADPSVPEAEGAPEAPSDGPDSEQSKEEAEEEVAEEEAAEKEADKEEASRGPTDIEPDAEEPEPAPATAEAEQEKQKTGEEAAQEEPAKEVAEAEESAEKSEPESATAEAETKLAETSEAPDEESDESEPEAAKAKAAAQIEIPSEVDPDQERTGTVEALAEIVDEAEAPEASEAGLEPSEIDEPATELEIEGLTQPEPSSPKDSE